MADDTPPIPGAGASSGAGSPPHAGPGNEGPAEPPRWWRRSPKGLLRGTGRRRRPRSRRHRLLRAGGAALAGVVVLGGAAVGALYVKLDGNIAGVDIDSVLGADRPEDMPHGSLDILVLGSDTRAGANDEYGQEDGARADTVMVVHVNEDRDAASIVSIPRDTLLPRPECRDLDGGTAPAEDRAIFNESYLVGGPACAVKTVESATGVRMDHYIEIDFKGFEKLVDALGGVEVTTKEPIQDKDSQLDLGPGTHRLGGEEALALVRTRKTIGDGSDLGRIQLQQTFIKALAEQVNEVGVLTHPKKLYDLANAATSAVTTDSAIASVRQLTEVAQTLQDIEPHALQTVTVPVRYDTDDPNRVLPVPGKTKLLWQALKDDEPVPEKALEDPTPGSEDGKAVVESSPAEESRPARE